MGMCQRRLTLLWWNGYTLQVQYKVMKLVRWTLPIAVLIILVGLWASLRYRPSEFQGGVNMRVSGSWFSPRYRAELRPVSLNTPGEQQYALSGLPSDTFTLNLLIDSSQPEARSATARVQTRLTVQLTDDTGNKLCSADGVIGGGQHIWDSAWILATSPSWAYLWSPSCRDMPIRRGTGYQLTIRVADVDPSSPKVDLIPILRGGGVELP